MISILSEKGKERKRRGEREGEKEGMEGERGKEVRGGMHLPCNFLVGPHLCSIIF